MKSILLKNSRIMDAFTGFVTDSDILVENGVPGIVSARAQRDFFPDFLLLHIKS